MTPRRHLSRWAAPVGFLLVLTIAVVVIHNGLSGRHGGTPTVAATTAAPPATTVVTQKQQQATTGSIFTTTPAASTTGPEYYTIQSGDTYGSIAAHFGTTVAQLETLNPGVSPNSLSVGQKIRVK